MAKLYDLSDNSRIVKALKKGDSTAFEAVYKAYSGLLRTYATNILQDTDAAYEVVQDALIIFLMIIPSPPSRTAQ